LAGARNAQQAKENAQSAQVSLSAEDLETINKALEKL
jgi:aryl-alcohol dehydrogenase-like predicted oxidoreductase